MDAVEFLKGYHRICKSQGKCETCPLNDNEVDTCIVDIMPNKETAVDVNNVVSIVEQWAKDHPIKTRQSELLKMFPNAAMDGKVLAICPITIRGGSCSPNDCARCRRDYWLQEVE